MISVNRLTLIGRVGKDAEYRQLEGDRKVASFSVATSEKANGKEYTEWHKISAWGGLADICEKYVKKGVSVFCEGKLVTKKWTDKQGVERTTHEMLAGNVIVLGGRSGSSAPQDAEPVAENTAAQSQNTNDDLPF